MTFAIAARVEGADARRPTIDDETGPALTAARWRSPFVTRPELGGVAVRYETACSERLVGLRAVRAGDDSRRLMRLNGTSITWLPRRGPTSVAVANGRGSPGRPHEHG